MVKAVLFDLDNTLYDEREYVYGVLDVFCQRHNLDYDSACRGYHAALSSAATDILGAILNHVDVNSRTMHDALFNAYKQTPVRLSLFDDVEAALARFNALGIRTGILTNGVVDAQRNKVRCLDIEDRFDRIVYARAPGRDFEKPHPSGFRTVLEALHCHSDEALFVGDHPVTDIAGAQAIGLPAVQIRRNGLPAVRGSHIPTYPVIENLFQLLELLEDAA